MPSPAADAFRAISALPRVDLFRYRPFFVDDTRTIVLDGVNTRLTVGDWVMVVEQEGSTAREKATPYQLILVKADRAANTTTIAWTEPHGTTYDDSNGIDVAVYALRVTATAFGSNAPAYAALPADVQKAFSTNWDDPSKPASISVPGALWLDAVYDRARGTPPDDPPGGPGWAILIDDDGNAVPFRVTDARTVSHSDYTISAKVTQLTLEQVTPPPTFHLRTTTILAGSEPLTLHNNLPLPDPLVGQSLVLAGLYPNLRDGQQVVVRGNVFDPSTGAASTETFAEPGFIDGPPQLDRENSITRVTLKEPLAKQYARSTTVLLANVAAATQGETVRREVLGSGDGSALQSYALKKTPLTYLPSTDAEGLSAVTSTLTVTVNGVRWTEQPTLLESGSDAQEFTATQDDAGKTTVTFGDGVNGARPPSGKDNVVARYRKGLGTSGNVGTDAVQQLIDGVSGLQKVTNPQRSIGGADADGVAQIRQNAPGSIRTFGRAVSASDYATLALGYPGVAKASAAWVLRDDVTLRALEQPYVRLTVATSDATPLTQQTAFQAKLRAFVDKRRDPNVPLRIVDFTPVYVDVEVTVDVDDRYPRQATLARVLAAMTPDSPPDGPPGFFAFDRLDFGQSIYLSAVYAALQAVEGVHDATVTTLQRADTGSSSVPADILIRPTEIAVVANDVTEPAHGLLTVTLGSGGFADT